MKTKTSFKAFIMAVLCFVATYFSQTTSEINWSFLAISTVGFTLLYLGKNFVFPSVSIYGHFTLQDALSGLIIAISLAVSEYSASLITSTVIDWNFLLKSILTVSLGYFIKTILSIGKTEQV